MNPFETLQNIGNGMSGVIIGAVVSALASLSFNRYAEFKKTKHGFAFALAHLTTARPDFSDHAAGPVGFFHQTDAAIREKLDPYFFEFNMQNQKEAALQVQSFVHTASRHIWDVLKEVENASEMDPSVISFRGDRLRLSHTRIGFALRDVATTHAEKAFHLKPDWCMIVAGFPQPKYSPEEQKIK